MRRRVRGTGTRFTPDRRSASRKGITPSGETLRTPRALSLRTQPIAWARSVGLSNWMHGSCPEAVTATRLENQRATGLADSRDKTVAQRRITSSVSDGKCFFAVCSRLFHWLAIPRSLFESEYDSETNPGLRKLAP